MSKATEKGDKILQLGTLIVVLLKARNLNDKHSFRKQDVVAQATLNNVQKRSHVDIRGGQHPEWDCEVRFTVLKDIGPGGKNRKLEVACYAQEPKTEDLLGRATVDISDTLKTGEFDEWVSLDVDGVVRGDMYLEMSYYANAPAPAAAPKNKLLAPAQGSAIGRRPSKLSPSDRLSRPVQQNVPGPSRPSTRLHDQSNPTSSPLNNSIPPARTDGSLLGSLANDPVHTSAALSNTRNQRISQPQAIQSQPALLPDILRPGLGGRPSPPNVSLSPPNPYIRGSSIYTVVHSGLSNINDTSSNSYTKGGDAYIPEQQQAFGGRAYSPSPPGAFIPGNQTPPDRRSYSQASRVVSPNPYTGSGTLIPVGQQQQAPGGRTYSPVSSTVSLQVLHPSAPIPIATPNPYILSGGVLHLPETQLGPNSPSYTLAPASPPVRTSNSSNIDHSTNSCPGERTSFIPGSQQSLSGWGYLSAPPVDSTQTVGYANDVASMQTNGPSFPYNAGAKPSSSISSEPPAFPMPMVPIVVEPYGYRETSSSHYQPPLQTNPVSNTRSNDQEELDPYHLARYRTPLPLPTGSAKDSPLPPPLNTTPPQISSSPPVVITPTRVPDTARVEALRKVEQDAAWRKEQELKDMELAMLLDRELNL